ncbi:ferrous iron transport protein A [Ammonicoccus fulvus]|uniref:Ferrous iron transport protein A n=1 Tax=Ammonicoccus fulvus TaxID=3138240 RepID=A0ABZ3FPA5_9ACTN
MPRIKDESGQLTLAGAPARSRLVVVRLRTPADLARRLGALGVRPGVQVEVLHNASGGGRVIGVAGARLALDRRVLGDIEVRDVVGEESAATPDEVTR